MASRLACDVVQQSVSFTDIAQIVEHGNWIDTRIGGQSTAEDVREYLSMSLSAREYAEFLRRVQSMAKMASMLGKTLRIPVDRV